MYGISRGVQKGKPVKVVIYGVEGVGKSSLAACFPSPMFLDLEESTKYLDVARFDPGPRSWEELLSMVEWCSLGNMERGSTLVVDTLDAAEALCAAHVVAGDPKWTSIESPGYGKGYKMLQEEFASLTRALDLVVSAGVNVCCTAHAKIAKFELPDELGQFDRYAMKLTETKSVSVSAIVREWADAVLFANFESIVMRDEKSGKAKATGSKRVLHTEHDACWDAKNRWGLPAKLPLDFAEIANFVPKPDREGQRAELLRLMSKDGVDAAMLGRVCASQQILASDVPLDEYPPETVCRLVAGWPTVVEIAQELRAEESEGIPFN